MLINPPPPPDDPYLCVSQIISLLPAGRGSDRVHPATVVRWICTGVRTVTGGRVRLAASRLGSRWVVRRSDLEAFFEAQKPRFPESDTPAPRSPAAAERAAERAGRLLEQAGV